MKNKKVFLGGTCNGSKWREQLIGMLELDFFNPVVDDWNEEAQKEEILQRNICDYVLYTITPKMTGVYSIAEVVDDSNKRAHKTVLCILDKDGTDEFDKHQNNSLQMVKNMVENNGAYTFSSLKQTAEFLNQFK